LSKQKKSAATIEKKFENSKQKVEILEEQINGLHFSAEEFNAMDQEKVDLEAAITELEEQFDTVSTQLQSRLAFEYEDPVRGFDRSKVKGLIAKLVDVKDAKYATALEVVAGGKLFQVVVDEAITGKALLDRGKLTRRVTIIPLDKIRASQLSQSACRTAEEIASSMQCAATPAIELVGYDEEVRSAIEYVFGSAIVVDGIKAANKICEMTKTRTVTLEGDVYDPSGTISGGSKNQLGTTLSNLVTLAQCTQLLEEKSQRLAQVSAKVSSLQSASASYEKLSAKFELAKAELEAVKKQMSQTTYGVLVEKRDSMVADLKVAEEECLVMENEEKEKWALYEQLKEQEIELTQQREQRFADIEMAVKTAKDDAAEKQKLAREASSKTQTLELELESLKTELAAAQEAVKIAEKIFEESSRQESEMQVEVAETQASYEEARSNVAELERKVDDFSSQVAELKDRKAEFSKALEAATIEAKKLSVGIQQRQKERVGAEKVVSNLLKNYAWIESERGAFGVVGGDYDFDSCDTAQIAAEVKELKEQQDSLVSCQAYC
jgi:structural maintenance of chromosome 2